MLAAVQSWDSHLVGEILSGRSGWGLSGEQSLVWRRVIEEAVEVGGLQYSSKYHHFTSLQAFQSPQSTQPSLLKLSSKMNPEQKSCQHMLVITAMISEMIRVILVAECQCGDWYYWSVSLSLSAGWPGLWSGWLATTQVRTHWPGVGRSLTADSVAAGERRELPRAGQGWVGKLKCRQVGPGAGWMMGVRLGQWQLEQSQYEGKIQHFLLIIETPSLICSRRVSTLQWYISQHLH